MLLADVLKGDSYKNRLRDIDDGEDYVVPSTAVVCAIAEFHELEVEIESKIKKKWYPSSGNYIFGPDMSESEACNYAEQRAKKNIMRQKMRERLKSRSHLKCLQRQVSMSSKNSCNTIYMNVRMENEGIQKVKMRLCPK